MVFECNLGVGFCGECVGFSVEVRGIRGNLPTGAILYIPHKSPHPNTIHGSNQHGRWALGSGKTWALQQRTRELRAERNAADAVRRQELQAAGYSSMSDGDSGSECRMMAQVVPK